MGRRSAIKNDIIVINTYIHTLSNIHTCTIKHTYISHQIYIHVPSNIHTYPIKHMYLSYQMYIHCPSNVQTYPIKHTTITHQTYIHSPSNKKLLLKYPRQRQGKMRIQYSFFLRYVSYETVFVHIWREWLFSSHIWKLVESYNKIVTLQRNT